VSGSAANSGHCGSATRRPYEDDRSGRNGRDRGGRSDRNRCGRDHSAAQDNLRCGRVVRPGRLGVVVLSRHPGQGRPGLSGRCWERTRKELQLPWRRCHQLGDARAHRCRARGRARVRALLYGERHLWGGGCFDDVTLSIDGVAQTLVNPGAELGTTGWTNLHGAINSVTSSPGSGSPVGPHSGTHLFAGAAAGDGGYDEAYQEVSALRSAASSTDTVQNTLRLWGGYHPITFATDTGDQLFDPVGARGLVQQVGRCDRRHCPGARARPLRHLSRPSSRCRRRRGVPGRLGGHPPADLRRRGRDVARLERVGSRPDRRDRQRLRHRQGRDADRSSPRERRAQSRPIGASDARRQRPAVDRRRMTATSSSPPTPARR
jgi:hypothetical protein